MKSFHSKQSTLHLQVIHRVSLLSWRVFPQGPAPPTAALAEPRLYQQIIAHAAGNGLALTLGATLLGLWRLLADVREPALWAAVCSVVLRDLKQALVSGGLNLLQGRHAPLLGYHAF